VANERLGIVDERRAWRDSVLSSARISQAARARIMGRPVYRAPLVKVPAKAKDTPRPKKRLLGRRAGATTRSLQVIEAFAKAFRAHADDVLSPCHARNFARPRQAAIYFMSFELRMSNREICGLFVRDNSTIVSTKRRVAALLESDADFRDRYHRAERAIRAQWNAQ
jgi:hypothetical protein